MIKYIVFISLLISSLWGIYDYGVHTERRSWQQKTELLQKELDKQKEVADAHTKQITQSYAEELARLRLLNGSPRRDLGSAVRVYQPSTCSSETIPSSQASGAPEGTPSVVTEEEWERVNAARFSENLLQLEALRSWIDNLYRDYFK